MADRKQIRDQLALQIADGYAGTIYTSRSIDAREEDEFVNVFFSEGAVLSAGMDEATEAEIIVGINKRAASDDALDAIGDAISSAIDADITLGNYASGIVYTGFSYSDDEQTGFSQLFLKYTIIYED